MADVESWKRCLRYLGSSKHPNWRACDIDSEIDDIDQIDEGEDKEKHKSALFGDGYYSLLDRFEDLMQRGEEGEQKHGTQNKGSKQKGGGKEEIKYKSVVGPEGYIKDLPYQCQEKLVLYLRKSESVLKGWDHIIEKFEIPLNVHSEIHCTCCSDGSRCRSFLYTLSQRDPDYTLLSYIQTMRNIESETLRQGALLLRRDLKAAGVKEETALPDAIEQHPLVSLRSCHIVKRNWKFVARKLAEHWCRHGQDPLEPFLVYEELQSFSEMVILHLVGRNITLGKLVEYCEGWNMDIVQYINSL